MKVKVFIDIQGKKLERYQYSNCKVTLAEGNVLSIWKKNPDRLWELKPWFIIKGDWKIQTYNTDELYVDVFSDDYTKF